MSFFRLSLLILLSYFSIFCCNKQELNLYAYPYTVYSNDFDIEKEVLPDISDIEKNGVESYELFPIEEDDSFKVGLLVPLTGTSENIGKSILKSAEMALFNSRNKNIKLIIEDTKGTTIGAKMAVQLAISKGAKILLGPVFSNTTESIKNIANKNDINIISFSNNWELASKRTLLMGFIPYYQIMEILEYANRRGYKKLAVIIPDDKYGKLVSQIIETNNVIDVVKMETLPKDADVQKFIENFSGHNERKQKLEEEIEFYQAFIDEKENLSEEMADIDLKNKMSNEEFFNKYAKLKELESIEDAIEGELNKLENKTTAGELEFDAILLPFGGDKLREIASLLSYYDVSPDKVKFLGTGLFDDRTINDEPSLVKAWYSAPYSKKLANFENDYKNNFKQSPIRIASIAYDAMFLISTLLEMDKKVEFDNLINESGFVGIDGVFRFNKSGVVERDLSIMEIQRKGNPKKIK